MRLLSRHDGQLHFTEVSAPRSYAILSHTWGKKDEEVTYLDICNQTWQAKLGFKKTDFCLEQARRDGYEHVWIDTCCIDKRDFNELTEAINSMYEWYARAAVCYVYLEDVSSQDWEQSFSKSRWFLRGWTLQELLAPSDVRFFSRDRKLLGDKQSLQLQISAATLIDMQKPLKAVPFSERYQWSLRRSTSRAEDIAYCMVGLLDVHLTFMYGEGEEAARDRLFDEVTSEHGRRVGKEIREKFLLYRPEENNQGKIDLLQLLKSLAYPSMNSRREAIAKPLPQTCTWLLEQFQYRQWLSMNGKAFLWLKGKPGVGKSTLIKFADSAAVEADQNSTIQLSFYFNARGAQIDGSTIGMYRALLYQLLQQAMYVQAPVLNHVARVNENLDEWTLAALQELLYIAVAKLIKPVRCYIDALDECPTKDVQDMVYFLRDLTLSGAKLYVCFASRHYPTVTITHSVQLHIEDQHHSDLARYVTVNLDLDGLEGDELKGQVIVKANGVFLWAVLAVGMLNKEISEGSLYDSQLALSRLPGQLIELLEKVALQKGDDDERFRRSMHWILYSRTPLDRGQYYNLMAVEFSGLPSHVVRENSVDSRQVDRFVSSSSRGLAELPQDLTLPVQFIHESVRDFLLKHDGLRKLHQDIISPIESCIEEQLKLVCLKLLPEPFPVASDEMEVISESTQPVLDSRGIKALLEYTIPGVKYAINSLCMHAELASVDVSQVEFLKEFQSRQFQRWRHMFAVSDIDLQQAGDQLLPMHVFAANGCSRLIQTAYELGFVMENSSQSPFLLAVRKGHVGAADTLLRCGANINATDQDGSTALQILLRGSSVNRALVQILLQHGADPELRSSGSNTSLMETLWKHDLTLAETLLINGANTESRHANNSTLLFACCSDSFLEATNLLLKYGADVLAVDDFGYTVLMYACERLEVRTIRRLLQTPALKKSGEQALADALFVACQCGHTMVIQLLLDAGADPNSVRSRGKTALMVASERKNREAVLLLLKSGARAHAVDEDGQSALSWYQNSWYLDLDNDAHSIKTILVQAMDGMNTGG